MNNRIKELRKALGLTQKEFGERIGVKPNTIATYEIGRNEPIDAVLELICREFKVNDRWLRFGEGEKFLQLTPSQEIADFMSPLLQEESDEFKRRFITMLARLTEDDWKVLAKMAEEMTKG